MKYSNLKSIGPHFQPPGVKCDWEDGMSTILTYVTLRAFCPCAVCRAAKQAIKTGDKRGALYEDLPPQAYELKGVSWVGNYAIGLKWGDGHCDGIYPFGFLRDLATYEAENMARDILGEDAVNLLKKT